MILEAFYNPNNSLILLVFEVLSVSQWALLSFLHIFFPSNWRRAPDWCPQICISQPNFRKCFFSLPVPLSNAADENGIHTGPVLQKGYQGTLTNYYHTPHGHRGITSCLWVHLLCWPNIFWWTGNCLSIWGIPGKIRSGLSQSRQVLHSEITTSGKNTVSENTSDRTWIIAWISIIKIWHPGDF